MQITRNFIINDYGGIVAIDHDDGSAYYIMIGLIS